MTSSLKFNKKVYVLPEDKYLDLVKGREMRDADVVERESVRLQQPPAHATKAKVESLRTLGSGANEDVGGPRTHSPEKDDTPASSTDGDENNKLEGEDSKRKRENGREREIEGGKDSDVSVDTPRHKQESLLRMALSKLLRSTEQRRNVMTIYERLFNDGSGKKRISSGEILTIPGLPDCELHNALLHTQSEDWQRPDRYKAFYGQILESDVPLDSIGNDKLRRVLHYLKNKRAKNRRNRSSADKNSGRTSRETNDVASKKTATGMAGETNKKKKKNKKNENKSEDLRSARRYWRFVKPLTKKKRNADWVQL